MSTDYEKPAFKGIKVGVVREGYHRWENAPDKCAYLRNWHRHLFKISVTIEITNNDRELEFHEMQKLVNHIIDTNYIPEYEDHTFSFSWESFYDDTGQGRDEDVFVINSCEDFAEWLGKRLYELFEHKRGITVSVSEDGENSGMVVFG